MAGCSANFQLGNKYVDVLSMGGHTVTWDVDANGVDCSVGNVEGEVRLNGLDSSVNLSRHYLYLNGPKYVYQNLYEDGPYSFLELPVGSYSSQLYSYFQAPYNAIYWPYNYRGVVVDGAKTTTHDQIHSVGTAHGFLNLSGAWSLSDANTGYAYGGAQNSTTVLDDIDPSTGEFHWVSPVGPLSESQYYFYFDNYSSGAASRSYSQIYFYPYVNRHNAEITEGGSADFGAIALETSQADVVFQVADPAVDLSSLWFYGNGYLRDPATNTTQSRTYLYHYNYGLSGNTLGNTYTALVRAMPGTYQLSAFGYGNDGKRYDANFELILGAPQNTPVGSGISQEFTSESGDTIGSITFDNVAEAGETTISELTAGPGAPKDFKIFKAGGQPWYLDISTTAVFDGAVQVCINYSDTDLSDANKEADMELGHFACDADGLNCTWEVDHPGRLPGCGPKRDLWIHREFLDLRNFGERYPRYGRRRCSR